MSGRQPIGTAPRDGTLIFVSNPDCGEFAMRWGHIQRNPLFAGDTVGMWVTPCGGATWTEAGGAGPTEWRPIA